MPRRNFPGTRRNENLIKLGAVAPCHKRRIGVAICLVVTLGVFGAPNVSTAQSATKVYRIGWLGDGDPQSGANHRVGEFQQGLLDAGYIEGKNLVIEYRFGGNAERLAVFASDLATLHVDVMVTSGELAAFAAKRATKTIPIVVTQIAIDPVKSGLVASLARPEANVTGLATISDELWQKRLGLLKEVVPSISRVALLWNPANPGNARCVEEIKAAAPAMNLKVLTFEVRDANAVDRALASIADASADALVVCSDGVLLEHAKAVADLAFRRRMPMISPLKEYVQAGGLLSFGSSLTAERRRTAYYADRILKGTRVADLPVERPTLFELAVNRKTAKALGLTLPVSLLVLADELIE